VVLHESGIPEIPFPRPYRRVEMRLADGRGLLLTADLDPDSGRPSYAVEGLRLDPATGEESGPDPRDRRTFGDPEEWRREAETLRRGGALG
jgi:hypothetical protein